MANSCVDDKNFGQVDTVLQFGRQFTTVVHDVQTNSTADGNFTGNHAGTVYINQSTTYTNPTTITQLVTPIFIRPDRRIYAIQPQTARFEEQYAFTIGGPPGVPAMSLQSRFGGGCPLSIGGGWYMSEAGATWAPFGQQTLLAGQGIRIDYQCRLFTTNAASGGKFANARNHRIVILSDINPDSLL